MKIYTRIGDRGETRLFGGEKVDKDNPLIEAYGTVDELNATMGVIESILDESMETLSGNIKIIQNQLHVICANLADQTDKENKPAIQQRHIKNLEDLCDEYDAHTPELKKFIIPGGGYEASLLHQARTICRRAERRTFTASKSYKINPTVIQYLNRLSDLLFIFARYANSKKNHPEIHPDYSS